MTVETNIPVGNGTLRRDEWHTIEGNANTKDGEWMGKVNLSYPGAFAIRVIEKSGRSAVTRFIVDPVLPLVHGVNVLLDGIVVQTVLSKLIRSIEHWDEEFQLTTISGYNFIHFSPIQQLGQSNSCYSIYDQLSFAPSLFQFELNRNQQKIEFKQAIEKLHHQNGLLSMTDVVLNHTANNTPWLETQIDASYNTRNSIYLLPAFKLDQLIFDVSQLRNGTIISDPGVIDQIVDVIAQRLPELKLWEYYQIDIDSVMQDFESISTRKSVNDVSKLKLFRDSLYQKEHETRLGINSKAFSCVSESHECLEILTELNHELYTLYERDIDIAMTNIRNTAKYQWLEKRGATGVLLNGESIVERYFTTSFKDLAFANNGFIWNGNPLENFAAPETIPRCSNAYFRRSIVIWADCVKLRYGSCENDSKWLWNHMKQYMELTAELFHGIRIDNAHGTPLHVAQTMLDHARRIRPHLYVCAELFTGSESLDIYYASELGISALIREAMQVSSVKELGHLVHTLSDHPVGSFISRQEREAQCLPSQLSAIFFDCTHDNQTPSGTETLGIAALVAMTQCAIGSTRGYDQLVPKTLSVITESRPYLPPPGSIEALQQFNGFVAVKRMLNSLHCWMARENFHEVYAHHDYPDVLTITRSNPETLQSVVALTRLPTDTAAAAGAADFVFEPQGQIEKVLLYARLDVPDQTFVENYEYINGLKFTMTFSTEKTIDMKNFPPGSLVMYLVQNQAQPIDKSELEECLADPELGLEQYGTLLYSCGPEELDISLNSRSVYVVPSFGPLPWSGIAGAFAIFRQMAKTNDLGHPLAQNVRDGMWLCHYLTDRLSQDKKLGRIQAFLAKEIKQIERLPRGLRPERLWRLLDLMYHKVSDVVVSRMSVFVQNGSTFVKQLALTPIMLIRSIPSAPLSSSIRFSLAAGLPHFSTGVMRNWGRDTFISLRGLVLVTGQYETAKHILLAYASVVRHGLVPNLMAGGENPRYNARDATWWFLQALQDYCVISEDYQILQSWIETQQCTLIEVVMEILKKHVAGIDFIEENAGPKLDQHMTTEGFHIQIWWDHETGFIHGGNTKNCGTWMDKMGQDGVPATPRDGVAIELIGLLASCLKWLIRIESLINLDRVHPDLTFQDWYARLKESFEPCFYISATDPSDYVNRRQIYKDTVGSGAGWADYQLRPNQVVAMALAPELFTPEHAQLALESIEQHLLGPLGMKTLDPQDWAYRGDYDNSNQSDDPTIAHGFNYHQGPEWLWPVGYYLRARYNFPRSDSENALQFTNRILARHAEYLENSTVMALPELTNSNGAFCKDSCQVQAWSMATLLDAFYDLGSHG